MTHRLILMLSAIFLMFAVFGFIFALGADIGDNDDIASGNLSLGLIMIGASIITLLVGMRMQRRFDARVDATISELGHPTGSFEAFDFANALAISVDDARDVLEKKARTAGWVCEELEQYNARYTMQR